MSEEKYEELDEEEIGESNDSDTQTEEQQTLKDVFCAIGKSLAIFLGVLLIAVLSLLTVYALFHFVIIPYWTFIWISVGLLLYFSATAAFMYCAICEMEIGPPGHSDGRAMSVLSLVMNLVWTGVILFIYYMWRDSNKEFHWDSKTSSSYYTYPKPGHVFHIFLYSSFVVSVGYCVLILFTTSRYFYRKRQTTTAAAAVNP